MLVSLVVGCVLGLLTVRLDDGAALVQALVSVLSMAPWEVLIGLVPGECRCMRWRGPGAVLHSPWPWCSGCSPAWCACWVRRVVWQR